MQIIHERKAEHIEEYSLVFEWPGQPGTGFSFPCDTQGNVLRDQLGPEGLLNLERCTSGYYYEIIPQGVKDYSYTYYTHAIGRCGGCGREVELIDPLTNTCDCELEYNMSGQLLAPRSQWEEPWDED